MIQFTKLKLAGFKSFVDPVEMLIEPGMTGVVGPNGCGKSNLFEALRWAMGESSARQMRGGEMDDVIFGGTSNRPARNVAEVTLGLDNSARSAPPQFASDELEISRRIERGQGSNFRINGRDVRARDVQLLFADAATGSRSSGVVSQGKIGAIINAKPADRRGLLEEAAGISGLYSRRHEAELRLKGAETNLDRLGDVLATLDEQLKSLEKQARQANRYRTLSEQIRALDAKLLYLDWLGALAGVDGARKALAEAGNRVEAATLQAADAARLQAEAAARLPELRKADNLAQDALRQLLAERERIEAEAGRLAETRRDLEQRLAQAASDLAREQARAADSADAAARLEAERDAVLAASSGEAPARAQAEAAVETAAQAAAALERELSRLMEEMAAADAERAAALRRRQEAENRRDRQKERLAQLDTARMQAEAEGLDRALLTAAEMELEEALEYQEEARLGAEDGERRLTGAKAEAEAAREACRAAATARARLKAEADALVAVLAQGAMPEHQTALDQIRAATGFEPALAAALGDDLAASLDEAAPLHWRPLPPLDHPPALPEGVPPLARSVTAPAALARRLHQVGVAADLTMARALQPTLAPGQRLVTADGDMVRWDGFTQKAGAPSPMALRLAQRNRLRELEARIEDASLGLEQAETTAEHATRAAEAAQEISRAAREAAKAAEGGVARTREHHAKLAQRFAVAEQRLAGLVEQAAAARADFEEAEAELLAALEAVQAFPAGDDGREQIERLRAEMAQKRSNLVEARSALDLLLREMGERRRRLEQIDTDIASWRQRAESAQAHMDELAERRETVLIEIERLSSLPDTLARRQAALMDRIEAADQARRASAEALIVAEQHLAEADRTARAAEAVLAGEREERIRREAAVAVADQAARAVAARIGERLDVSPEQLRDLAGLVEDERPEPGELQHRLDRLTRERDAMGPVNLRAEIEVKELGERIATATAERDDLLKAIAKLRQAIAELNKEGRERLLASFQDVDRHFRELFVRLFGGGRAHLALTESDDPLEAGLEIMASPPGKRLQQLSLLSGGEQALTALALLFAVFMTNPAPICVLDEVDAPLDDANVDRFCSLVENIAGSTRTRFLIVTHHRMTMARMDRLYGVTMAERGVSKLVSVDLAGAWAIREQGVA